MANTNKESTRYYSDLQENHIARRFDGRRTANSGANRFDKGDIIVEDASMLIEAKTSLSEKSSFSVKKEWIEKNKEEAFRNRLSNQAIAISFDPKGTENYYLINEKLFEYLIDKLKEDLEN